MSIGVDWPPSFHLKFPVSSLGMTISGLIGWGIPNKRQADISTHCQVSIDSMISADTEHCFFHCAITPNVLSRIQHIRRHGLDARGRADGGGAGAGGRRGRCRRILPVGCGDDGGGHLGSPRGPRVRPHGDEPPSSPAARSRRSGRLRAATRPDEPGNGRHGPTSSTAPDATGSQSAGVRRPRRCLWERLRPVS